MDKARLVSTRQELIANIARLQSYLASSPGPDADFARDLLKRGICFVVTHATAGIFFSPSRFVGYADNSRARHLANDTKDGRRTNPAISAVLGSQPAGDRKIEMQFRKFCLRNQIELPSVGTYGIGRRFWDDRSSGPGDSPAFRRDRVPRGVAAASDLEAQLTSALEEGYRRAGQEVGYWGTRFLQAVRRNGGLKTAKRMLEPRSPVQRKGLDALLEANRPELSLEAVVLEPRFRSLFTGDEIAAARERLGEIVKGGARSQRTRERLYPDDLEPGQPYVEGAKKQVRVNAYERNPRARKKCLQHFGYACAVCKFDFEAEYGAIGKRFIHVHHLKPLALTDGEYELDPTADLRPICPNCHAMIHRGKQPLSIQKLQQRLKLARGRRGTSAGDKNRG